MPDDIPSRLRAMAGPIVPNVCTEAADEIERLRAGGCARDQKTTQYCAEAARLQAERDAARDERNQASVQFLTGQMMLLGRVEELAKERDEARRMFCTYKGDSHSTLPEILAEEIGWDCFKRAP